MTPPPAWWAAIVCTICGACEVGDLGVYVARGHVLCVPCAETTETLLAAKRRARRKAKKAA